MEVYVEYVILDNFCVDYVLLALVAKVLGVKVRWWKMLIACVLGTVCAIVIPLFVLPVYVSIPLKLFVGAVLSLVVLWGQPHSVKFVGFVFLMVFTFALGGMTIAFIYLLTKNPVSSFAVSYGGGLPVGLLVLAVFFAMQGVLCLTKYLKERKKIGPFLRDIIFEVGGKRFEICGYMDSGNRLEDPLTGLPVVVVSKKVLVKKIPEIREGAMSGEWQKKYKFHSFDAKSAVGNAKMFAFCPDWIHIGNEKKRAVVGISEQTFTDIVKIDALFGPELA